MPVWNPWHGCHKTSPGCLNCYVYRRDESIGKDASVVSKTGDFDLPVRRNRQGGYKLTAEDGPVFACMTSDFFLEDADEWRQDCWNMIRERRDLQFHIITKRIDRFAQCLPPDWGDGWEHVTVCSTCEDQARTDCRLPILLSLPIRHREVISEPLLEKIDMERYLASGRIEQVTCGGESGPRARPCDLDWILEIRRQCVRCGVPFYFKQTGAVFVKDGRTYHIARKDQMPQAEKSGLSFTPDADAGGEREMVTIREATQQDAPALLGIYAYYVENTAVTFDCEVPSEADFRGRIANTLRHYPYLVLEEGGIIRGYAYAGPFVGRAAYGHSCEVTIYLDHGSRGRGFGRKLYEALERELRKRDIRNLYACIGDPDVEDEYLTHASERFHQRLGYVRAGTFHKCGYKFGRWYNMIWVNHPPHIDVGACRAA